MARITSRQVAEAAGVSQTTVSFVLNGRADQGISEQTRQVVRDTAERLGYVPRASGRTLRAGRSNVIVCIVPSLRVSDAMEVLKRQLSQSLEQAGYSCAFLHPTNHFLPLVDMWRHLDPAAVVAFANLSDRDAEDLRRADIPLLEGVLAPSPVPDGGLDQARIGYLQVSHLASLGHRHIGYAAVSDDAPEVLVCRPRLEGARRAAAELGLPDIVAEVMDYSAESAATSLDSFRSRAEPVTAVAAFNDIIALALLGACRREKLDVPEDFALIGVDDIPVASLSAPTLSTISMDLSVPAFSAATTILKLIGDPVTLTAPRNLEVLHLVRRGST